MTPANRRYRYRGKTGHVTRWRNLDHDEAILPPSKRVAAKLGPGYSCEIRTPIAETKVRVPNRRRA